MSVSVSEDLYGIVIGKSLSVVHHFDGSSDYYSSVSFLLSEKNYTGFRALEFDIPSSVLSFSDILLFKSYRFTFDWDELAISSISLV